MKTAFTFHDFIQYDDRNDHGFLAELETGDGVPVNVFAEPDSCFDLKEGDPCEVLVYGVCNNVSVFATEEEYGTSDIQMDVIAMIPAGTFPLDPDDEDFKPSPWIIYSGRVIQVEKLEAKKENRPNYFIVVETLGMITGLYTHFDGEIKPGNIVHGTAWLYGNIEAK